MKKKTSVIIVVLVVCLIGLGVFKSVSNFLNSEFAGSANEMFGDQHLRTSVALIELHKLRYGVYPETLQDLKFIGQWDMIHISSVTYYTNEDRTAYFIYVAKGWIGEVDLAIPDEYWQGLGYDESLKLQQ